jgi:DNA-directed RNA polymerase subunit RPC12/RpoP
MGVANLSHSKNWFGKSVAMERPDSYVCLKCGEKFQEAKYEQIEDDEGLFKLHPTCPKCGSTEIALKYWLEKQKPK